jgi:hypothetical protein
MNAHHLEHLIEAAATAKSNESYFALFDALSGVELFFNVIPDKNLPSSGTVVSGKEKRIHVPLQSVGESLKAMVFYSTNSNPVLNKPFAGIPWERALAMVSNMPDADGLVIQGSSNAWVAINRDTINKLLAVINV